MRKKDDTVEVMRFSIAIDEVTGFAQVPLPIFVMLCNGAKIMDAKQVDQTIQIALAA